MTLSIAVVAVIVVVLSSYTIPVLLGGVTPDMGIPSSVLNNRVASTTRHRLHILTYNMFLRPPLISDYKGDKKDQRLDDFIQHILPKYDVIAMQETYYRYSQRVSKLEKAALRDGYVSHYRGPHGSLLDLHLLDSGLLVLSRWPIISSDRITFSTGRTVDKLAAKGATYTLHHKDNIRLHLFNTHLQASYSAAPKKDDGDVQCRNQQLVELSHFIVDKHVDIHTQDVLAQINNIPFSSIPNRYLHHQSTLDKVSSVTTHHDNESTKPIDVILVCGDLNVNSLQDPNDEYRAMLKTLSYGNMFTVIDLLKDQNKEDYTHLPWKYFTKNPMAKSMWSPLRREVYETEGSRLDYILLLVPTHGVKPPVPEIHTRIDKCESSNPYFSQLSDHVGVAAEISLP